MESHMSLTVQAQRMDLRPPRMPRIPLPIPYNVKLVLDSICTTTRMRLTTFALTYWRAVHAELMTHRVFSRNSASSRAIPAHKMRKMIEETPALPVWWGKNQAGMQAREELPNNEEMRRITVTPPPSGIFLRSPGMPGELAETPLEYVKRRWLAARDIMLRFSDDLSDLGKVHPDWTGIGLHKQLCNRLTECWMPITVLVTSCTYNNWFHLRDHKDAQPELQIIATEMHYQYLESKPHELEPGEWHLPYISTTRRVGEDGPAGLDFQVPSDFEAADILVGSEYGASSIDILRKVSTGRCARVSYLTHEGKRDLVEDIKLHDKLKSTAFSEDPGHFSPFEHVAECLARKERIGNFTGYKQYRKYFPNEAGPGEESV
jgi:hypothetical protein